MTEERKEEQVQAEPSGPQYPHLFAHEDAGPLLAPFPGWFKVVAGFLEVHLTYYVHWQGVLLAAIVVQPNGQMRPWLRYWTSHVEAVREAESLCAEAVAYLDQMGEGKVPLRETEDLDLDDFIEHLRTRLNGEFH